MPPLWTIWTSPSVFITLQVPHRPKVQPEGMFSPLALATARTVSVSVQAAATPDRAKTTSATAVSSGTTSSSAGTSAAVRIGLVPKLPVLRIVSAGNVAGEGAKMVLLSSRERAGADALLREVSYVELSDRPDFNDRFVDLLAFP